MKTIVGSRELMSYLWSLSRLKAVLTKAVKMVIERWKTYWGRRIESVGD